MTARELRHRRTAGTWRQLHGIRLIGRCRQCGQFADNLDAHFLTCHAVGWRDAARLARLLLGGVVIILLILLAQWAFAAGDRSDVSPRPVVHCGAPMTERPPPWSPRTRYSRNMPSGAARSMNNCAG